MVPIRTPMVTVALAALLLTFPVVAAAQAGGVEVEAALALGIEDRMPVDTASTFPPDVGRVWLWTSVTGAEGQTISHVWSHGENEWTVNLQIAADRWRCWSNKTIPPDWTGEWQVEVRDGAGNVLETLAFTVGS
jgi:hypothetical protein